MVPAEKTVAPLGAVYSTASWQTSARSSAAGTKEWPPLQTGRIVGAYADRLGLVDARASNSYPTIPGSEFWPAPARDHPVRPLSST